MCESMRTYSVHIRMYMYVPSVWLVGCQLRFLVELLHLSQHTYVSYVSLCMAMHIRTYVRSVCLVVTI